MPARPHAEVSATAEQLAGTFDERWIKVLTHPLRIAILRYMFEHGDVTPAELSVELDVPMGVMSYHVRRLRDAKRIRLVRRTQHRGAVAHHYRLTSPEATRDAMRRVGLPILAVGAPEGASRNPWERLGRALGELRRLRVAQGISLDALARSLEIRPSELARIECGETDPPATVLMAIAYELGTTLGDVFAGTEA